MNEHQYFFFFYKANVHLFNQLYMSNNTTVIASSLKGKKSHFVKIIIQFNHQ